MSPDAGQFRLLIETKMESVADARAYLEQDGLCTRGKRPRQAHNDPEQQLTTAQSIRAHGDQNPYGSSLGAERIGVTIGRGETGVAGTCGAS